MVKGSPSVVVTVVDSADIKEEEGLSCLWLAWQTIASPRFRVYVYLVDGRACYMKYLSWLLYKCSQCQVLITIWNGVGWSQKNSALWYPPLSQSSLKGEDWGRDITRQIVWRWPSWKRDAKESNMVSGRKGWHRIEGVGSADCMDGTPCTQYSLNLKLVGS